MDYLAQTLFRPLLDGAAQTIEVKKAAEDDFIVGIDKELSGAVFSAGCSNWYINAEGRNSASPFPTTRASTDLHRFIYSGPYHDILFHLRHPLIYCSLIGRVLNGDGVLDTRNLDRITST